MKKDEINVRLELVSNGVVFTDLDCEDKYLATGFFFSERRSKIYKQLGSYLFSKINTRGLLGKNIELSIKVKEI